MNAFIRAAAPPGQYGDAQGWRALGVMKMAGERVFCSNDNTQYARWITCVEGFRPARRVRRWVGVLS